MARALQLARRGLYTAHPNPRVGCVLVKDGNVVGQGWHEFTGGPHAEICALADAGSKARAATCYVTFEPCAHYGRTPACVESLIANDVFRVVASMLDPNPKVHGKGLARLSQAGITVDEGLLKAEAEALNAGFIMRMCHGRPFVRCKLGMSMDGRTAMPVSRRQWITSPEARMDVQRLRARSSAIVTGIGTVLADDPSLTVRDPDLLGSDRQPLRGVVDSRLRMPEGARMLRLPGRTVVMTTSDDRAKRLRLTAAGAEVVRIPSDNGQVDLPGVLTYLAGLEVNEVLLEAGATLSGAMLQKGLIDELVLYVAPTLVGDAGRGLFQLVGLGTLAERIDVNIIDMRMIGPDLRLTAHIRA
ncbi:MAG: bifunctional diaminohydroxyphosphoribosylaminopyrimidine deaminase/5-amino-6-(5-phosphoribosylamino)uracil reductase RibD [Gammaproteobacteria bacterium]|nr:bifunctional diaminohydroxyphosphoribosylaminopyrimidine deaminase/5-amino-6-(5-phosphoribosylamino)uracil reductase RibD [Gammaproteobacteria bacterium]MCI0591698.1 bifunctional diaminohydroxyphosphoribosylaminopyrimidine deaminase/5-amino-6-(5-phosphoribosylamino)uracil reductase RibD [Gammaproteobacteria bacterium]